MSSKLAMNVTTWGVILVICLLTIIVPEDILTQFSNLNNFINAFAVFIPSIENLSRLSKFPEVTKFVLSVSWVLAIVVFVIYSYVVLGTSVPSTTIERLRPKRVLLTLITYIFLPALIWACVYLIGADIPRETGGLPGENLVRAAGESRFALAFVATITSLFVGSACMLLIYWTKLLPRLFGTQHRV